VELLEAHMAAQRLTQTAAALDLGFKYTGRIGQWLGRTSTPLSASLEAETDALVAAYLNDPGAPAPSTVESTGLPTLNY